jgi:hypothetical protein
MTWLFHKHAALVVSVSILGVAGVYFGMLYLIAH